MDHEIRPLTSEEESLIEKKINTYADSMAPSELRTGEEQNGFTPRGELEDYPKGHTAYKLEKRI